MNLMIVRLLFFMLFLPHFCFAQKQYETLLKIPITAQVFTTDKLQHCYIVDSINQVQKYAPDGQLLFEYTNNTLGRVGALDASDPFNIVLFYPDYQSIIFLDRTFTETQRISLLDAGFFDVKTIGLSRENQIWLYDANDFRLKRIDQTGRVRQQSDDLSLLLNESPKPTQIQEYANQVYVNSPGLGILVFDIFGNYLTRLDFRKVEHLQVTKQQLLFLDEKGLHRYHLKAKLTHTLFENREKIQNFRVQKDRLYLQDYEDIRILKSLE